MPTLRLVCSDPKVKRVELTESAVAIGRHPDNDVPINDDVASRFHCVIEREATGYVLKDLGSRNGTRVNGSRVSTSPLAPGDVITIGSHSFSVEMVEEAASRPRHKEGREQPTPQKKPAREARGSLPWAAELRGLIDALPPKEAQLEAVALSDANGNPTDALSGESDGATAIRLLLLAASKARATDIHFEPKIESGSIRMRVDGQMLSIIDLPKQVGELAQGLVRNACQLQQVARDVAQDGHFSARIAERRVDFRASFTPTIHGSKLVLRILDSRIAPQTLSDLNMPQYMLDRLRRVCDSDAGMLMSVGPTGSGKTTTLYNALREINRKRRNVVTIEDPVEYQIEGVTQIPVGHNNSFGGLLRSILRQDPDVILVGEIRDQETARTAMQAAMTGHVVFTTVHAKDTIGSVFRLLDLGIEAYLIANSLEVVIAQRLVRVLCEFCKRPVRVTPAQATRIGRYLEGKHDVFAATGCAKCLRTGFNGRRAIFEMLDFNDELRDCILREPTIAKMKKIIEQGVFTTLQQSGWVLAARGLTTLDEVERVVGV